MRAKLKLMKQPAIPDRTTVVDSPKQASQIFEEPVASRSSFCEGRCRMCHNFLLLNFGVKLNYTREKLLEQLLYEGESRGVAQFARILIQGASKR